MTATLGSVRPLGFGVTCDDHRVRKEEPAVGAVEQRPGRPGERAVPTRHTGDRSREAALMREATQVSVDPVGATVAEGEPGRGQRTRRGQDLPGGTWAGRGRQRGGCVSSHVLLPESGGRQGWSVGVGDPSWVSWTVRTARRHRC